jgi:hypothetical protein
MNSCTRFFFHSAHCLFSLIVVSFAVQKFLTWCNPICQFLLLLPEVLKSDWESCDLCLYLAVSPLRFPLVDSKFKKTVSAKQTNGSLGLTLKSLIHFELIFLQGEREGSQASSLLHEILRFCVIFLYFSLHTLI